MSDRGFQSRGPASQNLIGSGHARGEMGGNAHSKGGSAFLSSFIFAPHYPWEMLCRLPGLWGSVRVGEADRESGLNKII